MTQPKTRTFSLREERRRIQRENPPIEIELDDPDFLTADEYEGSETRSAASIPVKVPHPATWTDEVLELSATNAVGAARLLIGDDEYERFRAGGGSAMVIFDLVKLIQGAGVGESAPSSRS